MNKLLIVTKIGFLLMMTSRRRQRLGRDRREGEGLTTCSSKSQADLP